MVAATLPTNPFVDPPFPQPPPVASPTDRLYTSAQLSVSPRRLQTRAQNSRRAFDAGLTPATPFPVACQCVVQLFDTPDAPGIAAERFAKLRQAPRQSVDDFATELTRLASAAFPNLPHPDRDDLIIHRFISGLFDRTITDSFLLHPPRTLNDALRQCRLYLTYHRNHQPSTRPLLWKFMFCFGNPSSK
nr:unnamed protein product [Spirometra erinaceieuropaei]